MKEMLKDLLFLWWMIGVVVVAFVLIGLPLWVVLGFLYYFSLLNP
jgi:hypothetical protein